jgi:nicotinate-nucleotide pyrophosphorylase (carboxylating)
MKPSREPEERPRHVITPRSVRAIEREEGLLFPLSIDETRAIVKGALDEDAAFNDVTTLATVRSDRRTHAMLVARQPGIIAGVLLAIEAFRQLDDAVTVRVDAEDSTRVGAATPVLFLTGKARCLLSAERVALNFMQHLSGIATLTRQYVDLVEGTGAKILDTRKTLPGWRRLEKFAVRAGGGKNHRINLAAGVLIKDNHLAAVDGDIAVAVQRARELAPKGTKIEVECDTRAQVERAVAANADIIMLDNMGLDVMRECVELVDGRATLEASGGVTRDRVRAIADTGVDWISIGALTHSAPALDLALDFDP